MSSSSHRLTAGLLAKILACAGSRWFDRPGFSKRQPIDQVRTACRKLFVVASGIFVLLPMLANAGTVTNQQIFSLPVISRAYEQNQWVLRGSDGSGLRETAASVGAALAALQPSYVSGLIYLHGDTIVSDTMISDYNTIRSAVRSINPAARFDVEISLDPHPLGDGKPPFASGAAVVASMKRFQAQLHPDGWWFDFYSPAEKKHPDWITSAVNYAHSQGQTVGGNVYGNVIPPGSDAVAFVDDKAPGSQFGFDFNVKEVSALKAAAPKASSPPTIIIGHLQSNPQNGSTTESCVYIQKWTPERRLAYLQYWASQQPKVGFTFMYPVFYPLCPGAYAYDPLKDRFPDGTTLYDHLLLLINQQRG